MLSPNRKPRDYTTLSDDELVLLARDGDAAAYGELWQRHSGIGKSIARRFYEVADADDLVSEAFARILSTIQRGGGPRSGFRPYLITTVGNVARRWATRSREGASDELDLLVDPKTIDDPVVAGADREFALEAFRSLPERWQAVLWYSAVEGMGPSEIGRNLGMSANAASVLAHRAKAGLRTAWVQAHLNDETLSDECRWTSGRLGRRATGSLSTRELVKVREHLGTCLACRARAKELDQLSSKLAVLLIPALLGLGLTSLDRDGVATAAVVPFTKSAVLAPTHAWLAGAAAVVVTAAAIVTSSAPPDPVIAASDTRPVASPAFDPETREDGPDDTANEALPPLETLSEPTPAPRAPGSPSTPPAPPALPDPAPAPVPALSAPTLTTSFDSYRTRPPSISGVALPGATVVVTDELGSVITSVVADAAGAWSTGELASLSPATAALVFRQVDDSGVVSPPVTMPMDPRPFVLPTLPNGGTPHNAPFDLVVEGWPGSTVQVTFTPDVSEDYPTYGPATSSYPAIAVVIDSQGWGVVTVDSSISGGHRADFRYMDGARVSTGVHSYNFMVYLPD